MKILILNGPNLNMLGIREPEIYGKETYQDLINLLEEYAKKNNISLTCFQSNYEGALIEEIQKAYKTQDAIIINPAAYTHTSIAILDALKSVNLPTVEVHLSKVNERENFRQVSYVGMYCEKTISGKKFQGYIEAIDYLKNKYNKN